VCEGWRPPLVRPTGTTAVVVGDTVELTVPINAAGVVASTVVLGSDGSFVSKRTTGDGGVLLTGTTVEANVVDAPTGLKFPTRWQQQDGATTATTTLSSWTVNRGIAADRFSTAVPPGFTERAP
jgi:outer membrane lipoprotein-sorting protein